MYNFLLFSWRVNSHMILLSCIISASVDERAIQINFALEYLANAHLRFYRVSSDRLDECEYTL